MEGGWNVLLSGAEAFSRIVAVAGAGSKRCWCNGIDRDVPEDVAVS